MDYDIRDDDYCNTEYYKKRSIWFQMPQEVIEIPRVSILVEEPKIEEEPKVEMEETVEVQAVSEYDVLDQFVSEKMKIQKEISLEDIVHQKWMCSTGHSTAQWNYKKTLPVEHLLCKRRMMQIAYDLYPVEKQMFGLNVNGFNEITKDIQDSMPMLKGAAMDARLMVEDAKELLPMLKQTVFDTKRIAESVRGLLPMAESALQGGTRIASMIEFLRSQISGVVDIVDAGISSVKRKIKELIESVEANPLETFLILAAVGLPLFAFSAKCRSVGWLSMILLPFVGIQFGSSLKAMINWVVQNYEEIFKFSYKDREGVEKQSSMPGFSSESALYLLLVAMSLIVMGSIPAMGKMKNMVKKFGETGREFGGIAQGVKVAREFSTFLTECLFEIMGDAKITDSNLELVSEMAKMDVVAWMKNVHEISLEENKFTAFADPMKHKVIRNLYDESLLITRTICNKSLPMGLSRQLEKAIEMSKKLRNELNTYKGLGQWRVDPFHVSFSGVPGVGKSGMTKKFIDNWMDALGEAKCDRVYGRNPNSAHWSGYNNQTLVNYDDFGAIVNSSEVNDVAEMIGLKANTPIMLPMAAVEEKGKHFMSRYIVTSTNTEYMSSEAGLRCIAAFHRRRDCLIRCVFAKGYGPQSDETTKNPGEDENVLDGSASHMRFIFLDPKKERDGNLLFDGREFRYHEMFSIVMEKTAHYMENQKALKKKIAGDNFGKTFAERMKMDVQDVDYSDEQKEGVDNYYQWTKRFEELRKAMGDDVTKQATIDYAWEELKDVWEPPVEKQVMFEDDPSYNIAEEDERGYMNWDGFNMDFIAAGCVVDEEGNLHFFNALAADRYAECPEEQRECIARKARENMKKLIQNYDVQKIMQCLSPMTRRLMADMIKETELKATADAKACDLICLTPEAEEMWQEWDKHKRTIFLVCKTMADQIQRERTIYCQTEMALDGLITFFQRAWDEMSLEKRQALRIAFSAGGIVILASTIFGAYKYFTREEDHMPDAEFYSRPTADEVMSGRAEKEGLHPSDDPSTRRTGKKFMNRRIQMEGLHPSDDPSTRRAGKKDMNRRVYMESNSTPCMYFNEGHCYHGDECRFPHITYEEFHKEGLHPSDDPSTRRMAGFARKLRKVSMESENKNEKLRDLFPDITEDEVAAQSDSGFSFIKQKEWTMRVGMSKEEITVKKEWCKDPQAETLIDNKVSENTGILNWKGCIKMACLFVTDNMMLVPRHFFENMPEGTLFDVHVRGIRYEQVYDPNMYEMVDIRKNGATSEYVKDQGIYWCSARVQGCRSILDSLATKKDHESMTRRTGVLVNSGLNIGAVKIRERYLNVLEPMTHAMANGTQEPVKYKLDDNATRSSTKGWHWVLDGYRYIATTVNGECGSVIIQFNPATNGKIVAMHVAGSQLHNYGYGEAVVREYVLECMNRLMKRNPTKKQCGNLFDPLAEAIKSNDPYLQVRPDEFNTRRELPEGDITAIGSVSQKLAIFTNTGSDIVGSPIKQYLGPHKTEPAILSSWDQRLQNEDGTWKTFDPLISGISKYGKNTLPFDHRDLKIVKGYIFDTLSKLRNPRNKMQVLTLEECINGCPGYDFYDRLNLVTSEGAPWVKFRPTGETGKAWMFESTGEFYENGAEKRRIKYQPLARAYEFRMEEAKQGRRVHSLSTECTKDERRGLKKIYDLPNTRTFTILPVDFNMCVRTMFMDFSTLVMSNRHVLPPQVGINPESMEWTELFQRLTKNAEIGFAGDYKNFDGQICPEIFQMVAEICNELYDDGEENATARCVLMSEACSRMTLCKETVFNIRRGMPSGFPLTVIVNSIANWTYLLLAWLALARKWAPELATCEGFESNVECAVYGDDNCVAISYDVVEWYNLKTVATWLSQYSITLTDSNKQLAEKAEATIPIKEMTFLKREFIRAKKDGMFMLCPLDTQSIEERIKWVRMSSEVDNVTLTKENISNSMRDAFYHGEEYFNSLKKTINKACVVAELPELCTKLQYSELESVWYLNIKGIKACYKDC